MGVYENEEREQPLGEANSTEKESFKDGPKRHSNITTSSDAHTSHSKSSQETNNTDPLPPLDHALTITDVENHERAELTYTKTGASVATTGSRIPSFMVDFAADDPDDPKNWPVWYRGLVLSAISFSTWTVVLYSTSYTSSMPGMMKEFNQSSEPIATLGVTTYLLGLSVGSLILAPLSEIYGRRVVYMSSLAWFCLFVIPCALASSLSEVLVLRFFGAVGGAAMIANSPGSVADMFTEHYRALAFSICSLGPMNAPAIGPIVGGFTAEYLGWRWTNWIVLIVSGVGFVLCCLLQETYAPIILQRRAAKMRKETGDERYWSRYDHKLSFFQMMKTNLSRPFILSFTEPILWFWNAYVAIIYAILYLCFVAYPLIYSDLRGWSPGLTGLAFVGIAVGTTIAIVTEPLARRVVNAHRKDPETGKVPPEASISIICLAAFLCPIGQLWFSWTSLPITTHWIWPILAGVPFGAGNCLVFIYASNYLAGSYGIYTASALAGNTVVRSVMGGTLPLAGPAMYAKLTPQWAGTMLGLVQVALIPIPFIFYKWGDRIRARSPVIREMRAEQERRQQKADAAARRRQRQERRDMEAAHVVSTDADTKHKTGTAFSVEVEKA